ncbi:hypothetical protein H696_01689 [Fonticula alba]|uniref:Tetraspanin n=1 Tax=Fonticula alba TaxID=691883 RepID=A0A058ZFP1_FONAL|nr:hypothetical protein H696_01689 [Fonticula alba]KCV72292.1 hypothetical protein H696_01689 [Fonticula alba]|eukprot:XP_009493870.1 hypothetical protein H696_01689 [Fonticula alba]
MSCCSRFSRAMLILINIFFLVAGLGVLGGGIYTLVESNRLGIPSSICIGIIVTGSLVFLMSLVGLIGASRKKAGLLWFYFTLCLLVLLAQIAVAVVAYFFSDQSMEWLEEYGWDKASQETRDYIQDTFECCGFQHNEPGCPVDNGCGDQMYDTFVAYSTYVYIAGFVLVGFQVIGLIFTIIVAVSARKDSY